MTTDSSPPPRMEGFDHVSELSSRRGLGRRDFGSNVGNGPRSLSRRALPAIPIVSVLSSPVAIPISQPVPLGCAEKLLPASVQVSSKLQPVPLSPELSQFRYPWAELLDPPRVLSCTSHLLEYHSEPHIARLTASRRRAFLQSTRTPPKAPEKVDRQFAYWDI